MAKKRKTRASSPTITPEEHQIEEKQEDQQIQEQEDHIEEEEEEEEPINMEENENQKQIEEQQNQNQQEEAAANEDEEDGEEIEDEPVEKLLEPFSKEQLVLLLKEAVSKYPDVVSSVQNVADSDPAHRKIFVHGLGWDTTAETLRSEFAKYGEIEDCKAVADKLSGKSKGYAFILFKHRSGAKRALKEPQKKIGNRLASCQLASAGPVAPAGPVTPPVSEYTQRKIFVSNVGADLDPKKLLEFFSKFGEIEDGPLGLDKQTGKPKGFALFVYKTVESAKKALEEPHKNFEGYVLHCQKAIDGPKPNKPFHNQHHHHHQPSKKGKYSSSGGGGTGHLMAPSGPSVGYSPGGVAPQALTPALGQALTALLTTGGAGLGLGNLLGGGVNQGGMQPGMNNTGYGNQGSAGYVAQPGMQGGYQYPPMGQGVSRPQQGGASYMGHGH